MIQIDIVKLQMNVMKSQKSLRKLAEETGLQESLISRAVNHGGRVHLRTVGRLAAALGVEPQEIVMES